MSNGYNIGDTGPAGGIVFHDEKNSSKGWRYLEAAPDDIKSKVKFKWGTKGTKVTGTRNDVGSGKRNTEIIVKVLQQLGETGTAAQECEDLQVGEFKDWFLPSKDELNCMYENLKQNGNGNFNFKDDKYWSSSEEFPGRPKSYDEHACCQDFSDGKQSHYDKDNVFLVRAARRF